MKLIIAAILLMSDLIFTSPAHEDVRSGSININGIKRTYLIHLPSSDFHKHLPIVFMLHGGKGDGSSVIKLTRGEFNRLSDQKGFIVVYPDCLGTQWNDGRNEIPVKGKRTKDLPDDTGFISALIDELIIKYNADPERIYSTGISNGAMMSYRLGCELSDKIAAIAPVAGNIPVNLIPRFKPGKPVAVLAINGDEDPLVPIEGGEVTGPFGKKKLGKVISAHESVMYWTRNNGCSSSAIITESDPNPEDGTSIRKEVYPNKSNGKEVILYIIRGGGHTWPGGLQYLGKWVIGRTSKDLDATSIIWEFFEKQSLMR
jgi:polyhydroxybutyrate depolymerase